MAATAGAAAFWDIREARVEDGLCPTQSSSSRLLLQPKPFHCLLLEIVVGERTADNLTLQAQIESVGFTFCRTTNAIISHTRVWYTHIYKKKSPDRSTFSNHITKDDKIMTLPRKESVICVSSTFTYPLE